LIYSRVPLARKHKTKVISILINLIAALANGAFHSVNGLLATVFNWYSRS
jgi:hypothetical protein